MQIQGAANGRRVHTRNKKWVAGQSDAKNGRVKEGERWERGGHRRRGGGRGRGGFTGLYDAHLTVPSEAQNGDLSGADDDGVSAASAAEEDLELAQPEHEMESQEEADRIWLEVCFMLYIAYACALPPLQARRSAGGRTKDSHCRRQDGRSAQVKTSRGCHHVGRHMYGYVPQT